MIDLFGATVCFIRSNTLEDGHHVARVMAVQQEVTHLVKCFLLLWANNQYAVRSHSHTVK